MLSRKSWYACQELTSKAASKTNCRNSSLSCHVFKAASGMSPTTRGVTHTCDVLCGDTEKQRLEGFVVGKQPHSAMGVSELFAASSSGRRPMRVRGISSVIWQR